MFSASTAKYRRKKFDLYVFIKSILSLNLSISKREAFRGLTSVGGGGVQMFKNANSVPDVPRILIIRLKQRAMYVQVCAFPATDVLIVIGTFPLQFACPFPLILELYS